MDNTSMMIRRGAILDRRQPAYGKARSLWIYYRSPVRRRMDRHQFVPPLGRKVAVVEPQPRLGGGLQRIRLRNLAGVIEPVALSAMVISAQG
jgi:hypothetical protein